jgi:type III restriction enzyme
LEKHQFAGIATTDEATGRTQPLGLEKSAALWAHLQQVGHVNTAGKVQDQLRTALKDGTFTLPTEFQGQKAHIEDILRKLSGRLEIKNKADRRPVKTRQTVLHSPEFKALWDRIKHRTTYRVQFDNEALITKAIAAITAAPPIAKARLQWRKAGLAIGRAGIDATEKAGAATITLDEGDIVLPDILTELQDKTQLTRKTLVRILVESGRLDDFKRNPQQFIELASEAINRTKRLVLVDGIKYQRLGDEHFYAQELFEQEELSGYLKNMLDSEKSAYEQVIYDSDTEARFADELEKNIAVKIYAKLPGWFKVPTPLGSYNPDWAVLIEKDGTEKLYFVVETKHGLFNDDIRDRESAKINCGKAHFAAIATGENPAAFEKATKLADILS